MPILLHSRDGESILRMIVYQNRSSCYRAYKKIQCVLRFYRVCHCFLWPLTNRIKSKFLERFSGQMPRSR